MITSLTATKAKERVPEQTTAQTIRMQSIQMQSNMECRVTTTKPGVRNTGLQAVQIHLFLFKNTALLALVDGPVAGIAVA